jgi:hypothetical protein
MIDPREAQNLLQRMSTTSMRWRPGSEILTEAEAARMHLHPRLRGVAAL